MNCCQSASGSSGRAAQCDSGSTTNALDDEDDFGAHFSRPSRYIGAPLIMEAASKVDKCLARLQTLQGTVTVPKVHVSTTSSASTLSPHFSRSRSCLHGSPKVHDNDKIRIHDVLRWSDDFSGKYKQDRREKYMRRLSRSKTEVFDDKKDPLDPHGEWKHWSSPAGDVHKVISEILMASQIAKQITSLVSAAMVQSDVSSDEGKRIRRARRDTATSPNPIANPIMLERTRKGDPLHKFRVVVSSADGPAKKRNNTGNRKELLYPKSKQPIPDRFRNGDEIEVTSSTAKKMQSRRSPRTAFKDTRPQEDMWSAKDITNSSSRQPQVETRATKGVTKFQQLPIEMRAAKDITNSKSQQPQEDTWVGKDVTNSKPSQSQASLRAAKDMSHSKPQQSDKGAGNVVTNSKSSQSQADMWAATDVTNIKTIQSQSDVRAAKDIASSRSQQLQSHVWAAKEVMNGKSRQSQPDVWAAKDVTNSKPQRRGAPWPESKRLAPVNELQVAPYTVRRVRSSKSPPRTIVEKPKLSTSSKKPSFIVKQGSRGPQHVRMEPWAATSSISTTTASEQSTSNIMPDRHLSADTLPPIDSSLSSAAISEVKHCYPSPSALPVDILVLSARANALGDAKEASATSATTLEVKMCNPTREEFVEPPPDGFAVLRSTVPESITYSSPSSPQLKSPLKVTHQSARSNPLMGSLRHKFVLEATEIKDTSRSWRLSQSKSSKAVLFSNPAFAPASPNGARPASEMKQRPVASPPPKSPARSTSATRRVLDRIGRALSAGRRSMSPEITRRLNSTRQKLRYLSPGKSLPSLISRLPSRGKRKPSPVPRASIVRSTSCARPAPLSGELPLPPGRKSQQLAAASQQRMAADSENGPVAAFTDSSSYFSLRMLKDLNGNAPQMPQKRNSKGTTPDVAPRASISRDNGKQIRSHTSKDWGNEVGVVGVLSSCRKWVEESAPPLPGGVCKCEKENVEPAPQKILIKENVVATGWDDEAVAPAVLSTSRSRKVGDDIVLPAAGSSYTIPGDLQSSISGVRRSFSTGRLRPGASFLKRAKDWMRTQTPNRTRTHSPNWDQPRQAGLIL